MFRHFEKFYTYLPPVEECLLVPFYVEGKAVGTIWAISQGHRRKFDAEDMRQLVSLGRFASAAYQAVTSLKTKAQLAAIVESSDDAIMSTDLNGIILSWNAGAERLFGYTAEEAVGQSVTMVIPLDRLDEEPSILERIRRGEYTQYETVRHRKDGTLVDISLSLSPITDAPGKIVGASKIARDIAERKRAEEALRLSHVSLEHLVEQRTGSLLATQAELARVARVAIIGELTASIAHEINQPLAGIVANADACLAWLSRRQPNLDEAKKAAGSMILAATRASEVIARIRSLITKAAPERLKLNINEVIEEAVALARTEMMNNNVSVVTELASDLPIVLGDRIQLQQVILNLAMNGIAAMSSMNDRPRRLLIRSQTQDADRVLVAVQDSGTGMTPDVVARLFEPFFTTKSQGIGMGLPISRSIIEGHGGRLWAESTVFEGSTFQFTLPIEACDVA
jgi:PAS domain S-box-containing protein